jgi:hypothetical protein
MADKQALGARADLFAAHNSKQAHDVVAAVAAVPPLEQEGEDTTVAAVRPGAGSGYATTAADSGGQLEGQEEAGTRWQRTAGVPHADPRRSGQGREWAVFQPLLPRNARLPAPGRETKRPGAAQCRRRRAADPHAGSDIEQAFPCGHRGFIQHPSTSLFSTCLGSEAVWPGWSAHSLLRRPPGAAAIPGSGFFLEISFSRCSFSYFGRRFFESPKTAY